MVQQREVSSWPLIKMKKSKEIFIKKNNEINLPKIGNNRVRPTHLIYALTL